MTYYSTTSYSAGFFQARYDCTNMAGICASGACAESCDPYTSGYVIDFCHYYGCSHHEEWANAWHKAHVTPVADFSGRCGDVYIANCYRSLYYGGAIRETDGSSAPSTGVVSACSGPYTRGPIVGELQPGMIVQLDGYLHASPQPHLWTKIFYLYSY
jgi:hypothetical protein